MSENSSWEGQARWQEKLGDVRNLVRQELVSRQLADHLPPPSDNPLVLDVGCGQGTQLLALARKGYSVYGVDISTDLLARAEEDMAKEPPLVRSRVQLVHGDIHDLHAAVDRKFDVVLCHGLLMYLPSLEDSLRDLTAVLNRGAMISLLTRNRASIAMRAGMSSDWQAALDGFDARYYDNRVAVEGTRADEPSEVSHLLGQLGMEISAWFGVRLFTDHWSDMKPPENFDLLLAAEEEAGKRDPYRQLTSLTHVIARRVP